jgi:hypothetical protein
MGPLLVGDELVVLEARVPVVDEEAQEGIGVDHQGWPPGHLGRAGEGRPT